MDDLTERFAGLIADHGEKAVIAAMADYCGQKADDAPTYGDHAKAWGKRADWCDYHAEKDGKMYPIPASHGDKTEIPDVYVRGVCRALGLDEAEFRKNL